jgi:hypothetical protein
MLSSSGSFVAFRSTTSDLVAGEGGPMGTANVYVWQRATEETTLASESVDGAGQRGDADSFAPVITGDGAFVAFTSEASDLVSGVDIILRDVFIYERAAGSLVSASSRDAGADWFPVTANGPSNPTALGDPSEYPGRISANGQFVVFTSRAKDLTAGESGPDTNNVYLFDRSTGTSTLVSESIVSSGQRGDSHSSEPVISGDGAFVVFRSGATDLVAGGVAWGSSNLFLWERATGAITLVTSSAVVPGQAANGSAYEATISGDGSVVAFHGIATDLTAGETGAEGYNIYVWERATGSKTLVSRSIASPGQRASGFSQYPSLSYDGSALTFMSSAFDLVPSGVTPGILNTYYWTRATATISLVSSPAGADAFANDGSWNPVISANGAFVAFLSRATNLIAGSSGPGTANVYLWERAGGGKTLVSESMAAPGQRAEHNSSAPAINHDGSFVAFASIARDLVPNGPNWAFRNDVYLWERASGGLTLVSESATTPGQRGNGYADWPQVSDDGATVVFTSAATDLTVGATGPSGANIYRWDRGSEIAMLLSRSATSPSQRADKPSQKPAMSRDGAFVAFASEASDLVDRDWNLVSDVFLAELSPISGIFSDRFETGDTQRWSETED